MANSIGSKSDAYAAAAEKLITGTNDPETKVPSTASPSDKERPLGERFCAESAPIPTPQAKLFEHMDALSITQSRTTDPRLSPALPVRAMAQCAASHSQDSTETGTAAKLPAQQKLENDPTAECDAASPKYTAEDLRQAPNNLWYRLHVLTRDLRHFGDDRKALERLDRVTDPAYVGAPYFSEEEATMVKQFDAGSGSALAQLVASQLEERLNRRMKRRVESGDYRVCAAHDLAPVFEKALQLSPKDLVADVDFEKLVETNGLDLGEHENWTGLKKRRQPGPVKGGKRKNRKGRKS